MNIYESISAVMGEIGAIGKNSRNQQQGFMYRGVDAVMNAINPALTKYKVFVVPEVMEQTREERTTQKGGLLIYSICKMKYTFYAEDGSNVTAVVIGEGMDSGDKATNKAMSIAFKYACFQVFCIPTEEMRDPDADSPDPAPKRQKPKEEDEIISDKDLTTLREVLSGKGINEETVKSLYKLDALEKMTKKKYANVMQHIDDIKAKQEEKK
jgi:hypothetical protein